MHELSVCQGLVRQVEALAIQHNAAMITNIKLSIGPLSGVEPQLLAQAFPIAASGSRAEHACLEITVLPIRVSCSRCGAESTASVNHLICHQCGHWQTRLLSGDEMQLASIEFKKYQ